MVCGVRNEICKLESLAPKTDFGQTANLEQAAALGVETASEHCRYG